MCPTINLIGSMDVEDDFEAPRVKRSIVEHHVVRPVVERRVIEREVVQPVVERTVVHRVVQPVVERRIVCRPPIVRKVIVVHKPAAGAVLAWEDWDLNSHLAKFHKLILAHVPHAPLTLTTNGVCDGGSFFAFSCGRAHLPNSKRSGRVPHRA
jgi:hypothetical protein